MSQSGNTTYVKSMNGIITFDDGAGTVIEDGAITTDNFSTENFEATTIKTNDLQSILPADTPDLYTSTTGDITLGGSGRINLGTNRLYTTGSNLLNTTAGATVDLLTTTTNTIEIGKNGRINLGNNRFYILSDDLKHNDPAKPIELFTTTTADITLGQGGFINLGLNRFIVSGTDIYHKTAATAVNLFTNATGAIQLGGTGKINLGGTTKLYVLGSDLLHNTPATAVSLLNTTTGDITLGGTGKINLGNILSVNGNTIGSTGSGNTINMFNNILTGTYNLMTGIRTGGALNIATNENVTNTAPVNIGGTNSSATSGGLSRIKLNLNGDSIWSNTNTLTSFRSNGGINLASWASGTINIGAEAGTTSNINIGVAGNGKTTTISGDTCALATTNTTISSTTTTINNNLTIGSNKSIFTTLAQQIRLGYANTQTTATSSSSFGPYIKSYGPVTMPGVTLDILYEGTDGLFPTGCDGCGGLLTIYLKSNTGTPGGKFATYVYSMAKRNGITGFASLSAISLNHSGWTSQPGIGGGTGNNIRVTMNAADYTGATVSWMFLGSI